MAFRWWGATSAASRTSCATARQASSSHRGIRPRSPPHWSAWRRTRRWRGASARRGVGARGNSSAGRRSPPSGRSATRRRSLEQEDELVLPDERQKPPRRLEREPFQQGPRPTRAAVAPLHRMPAIGDDLQDVEAVLAKNAPPGRKREKLLVDVLLCRALVAEDSPPEEILVRHHDTEAGRRPGHAQHFAQALCHIEEVLERAEAGHVVE